jgi:single-strand DNA-binding protein
MRFFSLSVQANPQIFVIIIYVKNKFFGGFAMNSLNSILVEGNLVRDPNLSKTPRGTQVCTFSLASNRYYRMDNQSQKEVSFFEIEVWSKLADTCAENLRKGRGVRVVGRLKQDRWADAEGKNHSRIKIIGEHVEFKPEFSREKAGGIAVAEEEPEYSEEASVPESPGGRENL